MRLIDAERFLEEETEAYMNIAVKLSEDTRTYTVTNGQLNELVHKKIQMLLADAPEADPVKHGSWVEIDMSGLCKMTFREKWRTDDANYYEASDIKKYLDGLWAEWQK